MGSRTYIVAGILASSLFAGVAFAGQWTEKADKYFQRHCNNRATDLEAFLCDLRDRIDRIQLIPGPQGPKGDQGAPGSSAVAHCVSRTFKQDATVLKNCFDNNATGANANVNSVFQVVPSSGPDPFNRQSSCSTVVNCQQGEIATGGGCYYRPDYRVTKTTSTGSTVYDIHNPRSFTSRPLALENGTPFGWECFAPERVTADPAFEPPTAYVVCCAAQ